MSTRSIVLTDQYDALVDSLVASGEYRDASEVLAQGLRLVAE